jgi:ribonuclease III
VERIADNIAKDFNISFHDENLLYEAFTHSSYVNEHRHLALQDNERLEFLGDAVLEVVISDYLFHTYKHWHEGKMTRLRAQIVCEPSLSSFAKECHFDQYIRLGKGEENMGGRQRPALLCDVFESFIGAVYLDQGIDAARAFINQVMITKLKEDAFSHVMDYKTSLQEELQKNGDVAIQYVLLSEEGPAHARKFDVEVRAFGKVLGKGQGQSKKVAEQSAAKNALESLL